MDRATAEVFADQALRDNLPLKYVEGWRFGGFDRATSRAGITYYGRKKFYLSGPWVDVNDEYHVVQVILHELGHVAAGHKAGHGFEWRAAAARMGYVGGRCTPVTATVVRKKLWAATCGLGHTIHYGRRPSVRTVKFGKCPTCHLSLTWRNVRTGQRLTVA